MLWRYAYQFDGKQKLLSGGSYPATTILAARAWRDMMKHQLALGLDPSQERRKSKAKSSRTPASSETSGIRWSGTFEVNARPGIAGQRLRNPDARLRREGLRHGPPEQLRSAPVPARSFDSVD
jgi:hypothetical protein